MLIVAALALALALALAMPLAMPLTMPLTMAMAPVSATVAHNRRLLPAAVHHPRRVISRRLINDLRWPDIDHVWLRVNRLVLLVNHLRLPINRLWLGVNRLWLGVNRLWLGVNRLRLGVNRLLVRVPIPHLGLLVVDRVGVGGRHTQHKGAHPQGESRTRGGLGCATGTQRGNSQHSCTG